MLVVEVVHLARQHDVQPAMMSSPRCLSVILSASKAVTEGL